MKKIHCLNPIAKCGTELFPAGYEMTDKAADADAVLVRSASMHDMELPENLLAVGRAGAGVNNIPVSYTHLDVYKRQFQHHPADGCGAPGPEHLPSCSDKCGPHRGRHSHLGRHTGSGQL